MQQNGLTTPHGEIDVIASSLENLLTVVFPKSRSASYDGALSIAKHATAYCEQPVGGSTFHFASFGRSQEQAARALSVIRFVRGIKGFQVYTQGRQAQDWAAVERVLCCYLDAMECNNTGANCTVMVRSSFIKSVERAHEGAVFVGFPFGVEATNEDDCVAFPCRYLAFSGFKINPIHPASTQDQIQAGAVRLGCSWCPNFPHG